MRNLIDGPPVAQEDSPNGLPLQCVLKENDSSSTQWQDFGERISGVPNSRLLFLTVEYIQDSCNSETEFSNYSPSISENERFSPFDPSLSSGRYSPFYNTLVIPTEGQSQFHNSLVVLPASRHNSQQISIVMEQSQLRRELFEEDKGFQCQDPEISQENGYVTKINCNQNPSVLAQKLLNTTSPELVLPQETAVNSSDKKSDFLTNNNSFFQNQTQIVLSSNDYITSQTAAVQKELSLPSSHETVLLNGTIDEPNKSLVDPSKYVICGESLKQNGVLLSDSDQSNDLLMKSEALMVVDSYSLTTVTYITPGDTTSYPIIEQLNLNNIEKADNEYLLPDAAAYEGSDSSTLQSNLEIFTSQVLSNSELLPCDKFRLKQNKRHLYEHLGYDYFSGCEECEFGMKCSRHEVKIISDKPVLPRARATLPKELLTINKLHEGTEEEGVFARKTIMRRVQFGPVEGKLMSNWDDSKGKDPEAVELLLETETGHMLKLDVSDERESNWMRYVRKAKSFKEQNLILTQQGKSLYFTTTRVIPPRHELKVGYSPQYAEKRKLVILENPSWSCFQCSEKFSFSDELKKPLKVHENEKDAFGKLIMKPINSASRGTSNASFRRKVNRFSNIEGKDSQGRENECLNCHKIFPRAYSLKRHLMLVHTEKDKENSGVVKNLKEKTDKSSVMSTLFKKKHSSGSGSEWLCTHCNLTFDNPSVLNLHTLTHAAEDLESETVLGLPSELSSVYNKGEFLIENGDVQCPQCTQEFPSKRQLIDHVSTHGKMALKKCCPNPSKPYKCDQCYKAFTTDTRLQKHMLVHGSEETKPYQCNICLKRFLNNSALSCHRKTHNDKKVFECPLCKKEFEQVFGLKEHISIHSTDGFFTCPHCNKIFEGYSMVRKHIKAFHSGFQHVCKDCGKMCPTLDKLRMHSLKHSDHREFLCANCGKQFKRKDKLKEHMKRIHSAEREMKLLSLALRIPSTKGRKFTPKMSPLAYDRFIYKCRNCMVGFKRRGMLVNHLAKRHPDVVPDTVPELNLPILKTTKDYFCQYCDKIYKSSSKRKVHILKNHPGAELPMSNRQKGGVPYLPGVPNPTFSKTVGSVKTTPHGCKWCHKQYASKAKLLQHQRKKHVSLLPKAQQVPRMPKNIGGPLKSRTTNNSETSLLQEKWKGVKEGDCEIDGGKLNGINGPQSVQGVFAIGGETAQEIDGACKKSLRSFPENISSELFQQAMTELSQSLSEYKLPFTGTQESLLKMIELKDGSNEGTVREENTTNGQIPRTWPDLPPYPPR